MDAGNKRGTEQALRESERRLRTLMDNLPGMAYRCRDEPDWPMEFVSVGCVELTGYPAPELTLGGTVAYGDLIHPEDRERIRREVREALEQERPFQLEYRLVTRDGATKWVWEQGRAIGANADGTSILEAFVSDVTARKRAEDALRHREALLNEVGRIAGIGGWDMDLRTRKAEWTLGAYEIVEIEPGEPVPGPDEHLAYYLPEYRPVVAEAMRALIEDDVPLDFEAQLRTAKGNVKWCRAIGRTTRENGVCVRAHGTFQDITGRRRMEDELRELNAELEHRVRERTADLESANHELETFAYSVSHDLRAPLRAISGFAEIIARRHRDRLDEQGRHYFDNIIEASQRMGDLIDDLLAYSRLGRKGVRLAALCLDEPLTHALDALAPKMRATAARIETPDEAPRVTGDLTLLTQVFTNLLDNAMTYRRPGVAPSVRVTYEVTGDHVTVRVADDGIGIAPEHHEKVFNVFQRLHPDDIHPGTGVGLAIVKKALDLLGGEVGLDSRPGGGSCFWFRLPLAGGDTDGRERP